jgi:hypothetical protein
MVRLKAYGFVKSLFLEWTVIMHLKGLDGAGTILRAE